MNKIIILAAFIGLTGLFVGCNKDSGSSFTSGNGATAIAMVDPDRVTQAIGWTEQVNENLKQAQTEATRQVEAHIQPSKIALEQKKSEIFAAAKLTPEQIKTLNSKPTSRAELLAMGLSAQQVDDLLASGSVWQNEIANARSAIQQAMSRQNAAIQNSLRETLSPIIRQVAKDRGKVAVFMPQQGVWFDASTDITDDIIKEIQKRPSVKLILPEMPQLQWNANQPTTGPAGPTSLPSGPGIAPIIAPTTQPGAATKP